MLQLVAVDRDLANTAGPTPSATLLARFVGNFNPQPAASNASTGWIMSLNSVALTANTDFWLYNNNTMFSLNLGWVLKAQCWSPGT